MVGHLVLAQEILHSQKYEMSWEAGDRLYLLRVPGVVGAELGTFSIKESLRPQYPDRLLFMPNVAAVNEFARSIHSTKTHTLREVQQMMVAAQADGILRFLREGPFKLTAMLLIPGDLITPFGRSCLRNLISAQREVTLLVGLDNRHLPRQIQDLDIEAGEVVIVEDPAHEAANNENKEWKNDDIIYNQDKTGGEGGLTKILWSVVTASIVVAGLTLGWHLHTQWSKIMHATHGNTPKTGGNDGKKKGKPKKVVPVPSPNQGKFEDIYERVVKDIVHDEIRGSEDEWADNARTAIGELVSEPLAQGEADAISFVDQLDDMLNQIGRSDASLTLSNRLFDAMQFADEDAQFAAPTAWAIATPARKCLRFTPSSRTAGDGGRALRNDEEVAELRGMIEDLTAKVKTSEAVKNKLESEGTDVANELARLKAANASARAAIEKCLEAYREQPLWPYKGTTRSERMASGFFADVYGQEKRMHDFCHNVLIAKGLVGTDISDALLFAASVADALLLHDGANICNSVSGEMIARKIYGMLQALEGVANRADIKKYSRTTVQRYCVVGWRTQLSGAVQRQVLDEQKAQALAHKYGANQGADQ